MHNSLAAALTLVPFLAALAALVLAPGSVQPLPDQAIAPKARPLARPLAASQACLTAIAAALLAVILTQVHLILDFLATLYSAQQRAQALAA